MWMIGARLVERALGFVSIACFARLLTPADFGLVAMASSVAALIEVFSAFGFDWALVRHPAPERAHYDSAWTLRLLLGAASATVLVAAGPLAAAFYKQSAVAPLLAVLALSTLVSAAENIGVVDFRRDFQLNKEFLLRSASRIGGFILGLTVAYLTRSYWGLVLGTFGARAAATGMSYVLHPYRPRLSLAAAKELLGFSVWLLVTNLIAFMASRFADIFVGRVFGPRATGLYSVANEIAHLSTSELAAPINRAVFSMYSKHANDREAIQQDFLQVASIIWMVALPIAAGIFATSREIVVLMLGPQWTDADVLVRILAVGGGLAVMTANIHYVYIALGQARLSTIMAAVVLGTMVVLAPVGGAMLGVAGVGCAYLVSMAIGVPINYVVLKRLVGLQFHRLWRRVWRALVAALAMLALVLSVFPATQPSGPAQALVALALKALLGSGCYFAILLAAWRLSGRPEGPESMAISLVRDRVAGILRRR